MHTQDLSEYCQQFLDNKDLGDLPFFIEEDYTSSYFELITLSLSLSETLKRKPETTLGLQIESPYFFFAHLLAFFFAGKRPIIFSSKEPTFAMGHYQKEFGLAEVVTGLIGLGDQKTSLPKGDLPFEKLSLAILSSGSSGPSKAIFLTLQNIYASSMSVIDFFSMTKEHTSFFNLPHHHIGGLMILWRAFFSQGAVTNVPGKKYQYISLVPLQLRRALAQPEELSFLKNSRAILIGGAPLPSDLKEEAKAYGLSLYETYGMSETSSLVMLNGRPMKNQEIKLDSEGHFLIKGPTLSPFVPKDAEGFFHTKDIGKENPDGTFSFLYRSDILFKSAGELINPLEVESATKELPWIGEAVSVSVPHYKWTRAQALVYKTRDEKKTSEDIKEFLKTKLHPYHIPRLFLEANEGLFKEGMKPKRFRIEEFAKESFFQTLFHYEYFPQANAKRLVVFFHGFMGEGSDLKELTSNSLNSYLFIDLPGHGKTSLSSFDERDEVFFYLRELILFKAQNLPYTLYGYSMGGRVALELTLFHLNPDLLILESAHFGPSSLDEKKERLIQDRKLFSNVEDLSLFFSEWYKNPIFADYNQSSVYEHEIHKKLQGPLDAKTQWQNSLEFFSPGAASYIYNDVALKLRAQKIVGIVGEKDLKYKTHYETIKKDFLDFTLYEIKGAGHNPHKTHLKELKALLANKV